MFTDNSIASVFHYAPLHYLPFVCRSKSLKSKAELARSGFNERHFRSTSSRQDTVRGFKEYVHLTLDPYPAILRSKLVAGFPHIEFDIPADSVEKIDFCLCRFNIAKTRQFRGAKQAPLESRANGRYYDGFALPVARTSEEISDLLRLNYGTRMIEVLVKGVLALPENTIVRVFHRDDQSIAREVLAALGVGWRLSLLDGVAIYPRNSKHVRTVSEFIQTAMRDSTWLGNGLEFDSLGPPTV